MFCVVQTKKRKNCRPEITVVPSSWVDGKTVYWPPAGFVTLSQNANSCPDKGTWKKSKAKVLGQAASYTDAEIVLTSFQKLSESEVTDTETAGPSKPKKGRFESKQYELAPETSTTPVIISSQNLTEQVAVTSIVSEDNLEYQLVQLPNGQILKLLKTSITADNALSLSEDNHFDELIEFTKEEVYEPDESTLLPGAQSNSPAEVIVQMPDVTREASTTSQPFGSHADLHERLQNLERQIAEFNTRLTNLESQVAGQTSKLDTILRYAADVRKYFSIKPKIDTSAARKDEDFTSCKEMLTIKDNRDLLALEDSLSGQEFETKALRYYNTVYDLSGKRDGTKFFRGFMRATVPAVILLEYSWKGQQRQKKNPEPIDLLCTTNKSFMNSFPKFIEFVCKLVKAADFKSTNEATYTLFSNFLRHKKTEVKRSGGLENDLGKRAAKLSSSESSSESSDEEEETFIPEATVTESTTTTVHDLADQVE